MNIKFRDPALREIYESGKTRDARYRKLCRNAKLINGFKRAIGVMYSVESCKQLALFSFLHYEKLKYQTNENKSSVRLVNGMIERLIFTEIEDGIEVELIEIDDSHYGNK